MSQVEQPSPHATTPRRCVPLVAGAGSDENLPASLRPPPVDGVVGGGGGADRLQSREASSARRRRRATSPQPLAPPSKSVKRRTSAMGRLWRAVFRRQRRKSSRMDNYQFMSAERKRPCRPTFVFDPAGRICYYWSFVVSIEFLYNLWIVAYRFAFDEIRCETMQKWFILDYTADFVYFLDLLMGMRTGYYADGVLQTNTRKIRHYFTNSTEFYLDCLSLLPLDFLYLSFGFQSMVRCIRLVKIYKFWNFVDVTERHSSNPNSFRIAIMVHYVVLVFHWNACLLYKLRDMIVPHMSDYWHDGDRLQNYLTAYSLSCSTLLLLQTNPILPATNRRKETLCFIIAEQLFGILLLATILGYAANIVAQLSFDRRQFQANLDSVKSYMRLRRVPAYLQMKVIRWFDYLWRARKAKGMENEVLNFLPNRLKAEIAIQVHLDTLKRVEIFRNTEPGFLCELVLRLNPQLFSPGDYVCRKGEVGKEMYIINQGKLRVLNDEFGTVLATLSAGSYFGEISLLHVSSEGNRRTASVVSVGYSELLCLSKKDIWEVLEDYPAARERLEEIAHKRLKERRLQQEAQKRAAHCLRRRASAPIIRHQSLSLLMLRPRCETTKGRLPNLQEISPSGDDSDET